MKYLLLSLVFVFLVSCECGASELPDQECYKLDKLMKDSYMKGAETCKLMENFCTFTSSRETRSGMKYRYITQIPCEQFETYKVIQACTLEHEEVYHATERYNLTRECIVSKTN